jgi:hypothetical protein
MGTFNHATETPNPQDIPASAWQSKMSMAKTSRGTVPSSGKSMAVPKIAKQRFAGPVRCQVFWLRWPRSFLHFKSVI